MLFVALGIIAAGFNFYELNASNKRLRAAFCNIVQPYAATSTPANISEQALTLKNSFAIAGSKKGLGCSPNPTDGK